MFKERISIIPNGINLEEFENAFKSNNSFRKSLGIKENEKLILSIGRLEKIKGFQYLIMALAETQSKVDQIKLVIAGPEFNYGEQLRRLARQAKIEDKVIFCGPIEGRRKIEALATANIAVVPSIYEGFSIFLLEAMASGKPVIATKTGIAEDLIHDGKNGFLVNACDVKGLSEKILTVLSDSQLYSSISQESRNTAKAFDWKKIVEQILQLYYQSLEN